MDITHARKPKYATLLSALQALVVAAEGQDDTALPADVNARRLAIRRIGAELFDLGGMEAMNDAFAAMRDQAPDRTGRRETIIHQAWTGLPCWQAEATTR
ncbi:hypothetical protein MBUL_04480 (plasmid) [Methylobacterium bullatum]|uniref:Uncharacterized protein n=1 Tax=Methylobacterium bullatum TaxID=570505 RepID=A0A679JNS3_9HYPH|nr:hypothetical protein MBUL_04480 [Methylobacterium bullatum]